MKNTFHHVFYLLLIACLISNPIVVNAQSNVEIPQKQPIKSVIQEDAPQFENLTVQQLSLLNMANPLEFSLVGLMVLTYLAGSAGYYVTIGVMNNDNFMFAIIMNNLYLPSFAFSAGLQILALRFNLSLLGAVLGVPFNPENGLSFFIHYSLTRMTDPTEHPFAQFDRPVEQGEDDADNEYADPTDPTEPAITDPTPNNNITSDVTETCYYGCTVPNIDLDDSNHPDTDTYAGDKNACGPAAAANSLKWLSDLPDNGVTIGLSHRDLLEQLSHFMQRQRNKGVSPENFIRGKLDFITEFGLNINVKFQSESITDTVQGSFGFAYARNDNTGNYPTWDWLKQQMIDGEDVELLYKWPDGDGGWRGHVVTLTGFTETTNGEKRIAYKHDKKQGQADSGDKDVIQEWADVKVDSHGRMILHNNGRTKYIAHAVAESPGEPFTPVELTSFNASLNENDVLLSWITATEINNSGFELYRDGSLIKFINGSGTTSEEKYYSYTDQNLPNGIYEYELIQIDFDGTRESSAKINVEVDIPLKYELAQNYPNPFNPSTTISFTIPQSDFVTIKIFNSIGEEVVTLISELMDAGTHMIEFNADKLSNGVYVYTLQTGDHFQSKKMILLK